MLDGMAKDVQINVRVRSTLKADLEALADYQGLTLSSYVNSVLVRHVRKEQEAVPEAFALKVVQPVDQGERRIEYIDNAEFIELGENEEVENEDVNNNSKPIHKTRG